MKILITNPTLHYSHGHKFIQPDWPSLNLPYLAAICKGHTVRIVDHSHCQTYRLDKEIAEFKPDIVAWTIIAGRDVPSALTEIKKIKVPQIAGGQGAAMNAEALECVVVFDDEAEIALPHWLQTGVWKPFTRVNLDDSPFPRWDLMPKTKSLTFPTYTGAMEMSRGCPYHCEFCAIDKFWHSFRQKSNPRIMDELDMLMYTNRQHLYLSDDSFGINADKHIDLFDNMKDLGFHFFTQIRADTVAKNPAMIKAAAQAGLYGVLVGFDSYDNQTLHYNEKTTTSEINEAAVRILRENRIVVFGSHIYGLPGQASFEKTFERGRKNSHVFAMPYFDGRPKIARPKYDPAYARYVRSEQFSLRSVLGLFHPNKAVRVLKRGTFRKWWHCSRGYNKENRA